MQGTLQVTIRGAKNLYSKDSSSSCDPYCVYGFVQNRNSTRELRVFAKRKAACVDEPTGGKTRVLYETANPMWKHRAKLVVNKDLAESGRAFVAFQMFNRDKVGKDDFMGQVTFAVEELLLGVDGKFPVVGREGKKDKVQGFLKLKATFMPLEVQDVVKALRKGDSSAALQLLTHERAKHKERGASLLHIAAQGSCELDVLKAIIDSGVDVNEVSLSKKTPLALACATKRLDNVKLLLDSQADPMVKDRNGATLLHFAASGGNREIAELLIEIGVNVNHCTSATKKSPLWIAAHYGNTDVLKCLIAHGAKVNVHMLPERLTPLFTAVLEGSHECVRVLLDANADASEANGMLSTPLVSAIRKLATQPDTSTVNALLDEKYALDVTGERCGALHAAVAAGSLEVVAKLLARGAKPNAKKSGATPLSIAVEKNLVDIARLLIQHGADVNLRLDSWITDFKNVSLLHIAVERQHAAMVDLLLMQPRIDVNGKAFVSTVHESSKYTPLHCAVENNDTSAVKLLLAAQADASVKLKSSSPEYDGLNPYNLAVTLRFRQIVKILPKKETSKR